MRKTILLAAVVLAVSSASAAPRCLVNDNWTGPDKKKHLAAGMAIGAVGTLVLQDQEAGFRLGVAAGVGLELYSAVTRRGTCTLQDAVVTGLGAAAGAKGASWLIVPRRDGVQVAFVKSF